MFASSGVDGLFQAANHLIGSAEIVALKPIMFEIALVNRVAT